MLKAATRTTLGIAAACTVLAVLITTSALAAPTWLARVDVSLDGQSASRPQVGLDSQGDAVAVWYRSNGTNNIVQSAVRPASSGTWQAPVDLSEPGQNALFPQIAVDPQGTAIAVWQRFDGANFIVQAAVRPASTGVWQAPVDLSVAGQSASSPQVAVDPQGNAVAAWSRFNGTNSIIQAAARPAATGVWQAPSDVSVAGKDAVSPQVAIDSRGNAVAAWTRFNGTNNIIQSAVRPASSGVWQSPVDLSAAGQDATAAATAVDVRGNAVAVWYRSNGTNTIIQAATLPASSGVWESPVDLSATGQNAFSPQVALDQQGNAVAVWSRSNGANGIIQAAVRTLGGAWQTPVDLSVGGQSAAEPQVAFDPEGDAVAIWTRSTEKGVSLYAIQSAVRPASSGAWQAPVDLSVAGQNAFSPHVSLDAQGNAAAVWERSNGSNYIVQAAGYDAAGPQLRSTSIPTSGVAGQPLSFSVSPIDVWSALGATTWNFGDGTSASGTSVAHAYAAPGTYNMTLTSADVLGNASSTSGTVAISPPPPAPSAKPPPPSLSSVGMTNRRFRVAKRATAVSAKRRKAPLGTTFRFTLSAPAKVQVVITRTAVGLRRGRSCVAPTAKLRKAHAKPCKRTLTVGALTRASMPRGADRIAFSGRIGRRALKPGSHRALLTASNAGGRSHTVALGFVVVR
jgi:hypothetical protein